MIDWIDGMTVCEIFRQSKRRLNPEGIALIYKDQKITFAQLFENVSIMQWGLQQHGVKPGMHVGYSIGNSPDIIYLLLALVELRACAIPLHPLLPVPAKVKLLQDCQIEFFVTDAVAVAALVEQLNLLEFSCPILPLEELRQAPAGQLSDLYTASSDDVVMLISSSGTTGHPKFVEITHCNFANLIRVVAFYLRPLNNLQDPLLALMAFPLTTSAVITFTALTLLGCSLIILDNFSPHNFLSLVDKWKPTAIGGIPGYLQGLISLPSLGQYDLTSVERIYSGMDILSSWLVTGLREKFPNTRIVSTGYGLAETTMIILEWNASQPEDYQVPATHLKLVPDVGNEADVQNESGESCSTGVAGELVLRGPSVMKRYYRNPQGTQKAFNSAGWMYTGDIACKTPDGRFQLLGRKKYIIKRGGYSISPLVIHGVLLKLPEIADAAVVGVPHPLYGQMIWAFVQKKQENQLTTGTILSHCRHELPAFMVPDQVSFLEAIPKTPGVGKVDLEALIVKGKAELEKLEGGSNE